MQKSLGLIPADFIKTPKTEPKIDYEKEYEDCLSHINSFWSKIIHKPAREKVHNNFLNIPHYFITPNDTKFNYIFYWDTFFIFRGLMGTKREWVMREMVENFAYFLRKYGIIPNFSSHASVGRSQPPFLTSMILDAYKTFNNGNGARSTLSVLASFILEPHKTFGHLKWLSEKMETAKKEYNYVWNNSEHYNHYVGKYRLNRYGDRDIGYAHSSELESGWDFTSRFYGRCNEFLPICLNSYLYKYEKDFELSAIILEDKKEADFWEKQSEKRKNTMNRLMWNEEKGFFFDYGYVHERQSDFLSLAGFVPLWAGIATKNQARKMIYKLSYFETKYGLTITAGQSLAPKIDISRLPPRFRPVIKELIKPKQWDYPNIWPPLEYLTVIGLLRYGFVEDGRRIMEKSLEAHARIFRKYGTFYERINGVKGTRALNNGEYNLQSGFGWTNAIFYRYIKILQDLENGVNIYGFSKEEIPPYDLNILH